MSGPPAEGVIRLQNGNLLTLQLTGGNDCINFNAGTAVCTRIFQVLGGTGQMAGASGGTITVVEDVAPVVPGKYFFSVVTGGITGTISGMAADASQDAQQ